MRFGNAFRTAVLIFLFIILALGVHRLFTLRFEAGDIYAPYSSLRTDPLGCRALFDAFDLLPGIRVERHYLDFEDIVAADGKTVFFLGVTPEQLAFTLKHKGEKFLSLAEAGVRIVIALRPDRFPSNKEDEDIGGDAGQNGVSPGENKPEEADKRPADVGEAKSDDVWDIDVERFDKDEGLDRTIRSSLMLESVDLPASIPVYSRLYFRTGSEVWRTVYEVEGRPVAVEGAFGSGSIVLLSDSYLMSNEALRFEFSPKLLSWLINGNQTAVFDESHLGVFENPGVMSLVRKYRLTGFLAALAGLALLMAWKNSVPLVPVHMGPVGSGEPLMTEKDQFSGLVNLLRRNIGPDAILETCLEEWKKSFGRVQPGLDDDLGEVRNVISHEMAGSRKKNGPVHAYNRITGLLAERKGRWKPI